VAVTVVVSEVLEALSDNAVTMTVGFVGFVGFVVASLVVGSSVMVAVSMGSLVGSFVV